MGAGGACPEGDAKDCLSPNFLPNGQKMVEFRRQAPPASKQRPPWQLPPAPNRYQQPIRLFRPGTSWRSRLRLCHHEPLLFGLLGEGIDQGGIQPTRAFLAAVLVDIVAALGIQLGDFLLQFGASL